MKTSAGRSSDNSLKNAPRFYCELYVWNTIWVMTKYSMSYIDSVSLDLLEEYGVHVASKSHDVHWPFKQLL